MTGYSYLASPYSHPDPAVRQERYEAAEKAMAELMIAGGIIYSPIAMAHNAAVKYDMPKDSSWWRRHNFALLDGAADLLVLTIPGWEMSEGVKGEISHALSTGKPVRYLVEREGGWVIDWSKFPLEDKR